MRQHMQTRTGVSRFGEPPESELPDDIREIYEKNREKLGFIPNVFRAYARRPEHFRAFMGYHDVLMKGPGNLTRLEREAIVVAISSENRCQYCMVAHGAALRILGKDPIVAEQIANNWRTADISPRMRAMLAFASHVNEPGFAASEHEVDELHLAGFSDDDIWDIAAIAGFFGFSNRMAGVMDMRPNEEFYFMGRERAEQKPSGS
ncbi:MAG TPA: peroxidase-related enzyme [Candidatus Baltobacteraceae bacterium]|nr:peroxidase-related enzyme [Candidatus Baltobacteraceae bacterium]